MPSLIPGFEYDIFISYRHNDNQSGWVTEFVNALKEELAATIKAPLTIHLIKTRGFEFLRYPLSFLIVIKIMLNLTTPYFKNTLSSQYK